VDQASATVGFLKTELETGITFANLALSATDERKVARNTANARKAYDTAMKFMVGASLGADDSALLDPRLEKLRRQLVALGELPEG